jgi:hypothetical protein
LPWIVDAARVNRHGRFIIDGDAVLPRGDGIDQRLDQAGCGSA